MMLNPDDIGYFRQRAIEERERAKTARSPTIAQIHLALAIKYEELTRRLNGARALWEGDKPKTSPDDSAPQARR